MNDNMRTSIDIVSETNLVEQLLPGSLWVLAKTIWCTPCNNNETFAIVGSKNPCNEIALPVQHMLEAGSIVLLLSHDAKHESELYNPAHLLTALVGKRTYDIHIRIGKLHEKLKLLCKATQEHKNNQE
jgi:hypothetical protein